MNDKKVTIIGSGFAGLTTAALLGKEGFNVQIIEKLDQPGGKAIREERDGFVFDMGPSWYMMPEIYDSLFKKLGKARENYFSIKKLSPTYRAFFSDTNLDIYADRTKLFELFEEHEPGSSKRLEYLLDRAKKLYDESIDTFLYKKFDTFLDFYDPNFLVFFLKDNLFRSYENVINKNFKNKKLRDILSWHTVFIGGTPRKVPALYTLMLHVDIDLGTYYPDEGFHSLVNAMHEVCKEYGVDFHFNDEVKEITPSKGQYKIRTSDKEYISDIVVSNADYKHTENLLPSEFRQIPETSWKEKTFSPSCFLLFIGLDTRLPNLIHHNYYFSKFSKEHFESIEKEKEWPNAPSFYISCPSKTDDKISPRGSENLMVLVPIAPGIEDTNKSRERLEKYLLDKISDITNTKVREHIVTKKTFAVNDFFNYYNSYKGNAFGLANTLFQTGTFRPKLSHSKLKNFYFTGTTTIPGVGVPMAVISGEIVAREISNHE